MLVGVVTAEKLHAIFRELSYKQRNGVLSVDFDEGMLKVFFVEGRIASVQKQGEAAAFEVCRRLQLAGILPAKVVSAIAGSKAALGQLSQLLADKGFVSPDDFRRAKRAYELDLLHSLRGMKSGMVEFAAKATRHDDTLALGVYPGIALIDMLEFSEDEERFEVAFGGWNGDAICIEQREDPGNRLTAEERIVFELTAYGASPADILSRSLLSTYQVQQALIALYDLEAIGVRALQDSEEPDDEGSYDSAAAERAVEVLLEMSEGDTGEDAADPAQAAAVGRPHAGEQALDQAVQQPAADNAAFAAPPAATAQSGSTNDVSAGPSGIEHLDRALVAITLAFLASCALLVPGVFERWLEAIAALCSV